MNTHCKDCVFLVLESTSGQNRNCILNKIEQYKQHGYTVEYQDSIPKISKIICPFKRDFGWLENNSDVESIEEHIIKENGFPHSCFIYENGNIDIQKAVNEILLLDHCPQYLHITFKFMNQNDKLLQKLSKQIENHPKRPKYKLVINLDQELDDFYESFLAFRLNCETPFVSIYFDNIKIEPNCTTIISNKIQRDLFSFPYVTTKNYKFMIFPTSIIEEYINIEGSNFINKILETYPSCPNYRLYQTH